MVSKFSRPMKTTNSFSMSRFALLAKQYLIYNRKLILTSIFGFIGGLFVLFFAIQIITDFDAWRWDHFFFLFVGLFTVLAVAYSGSSFPGLRSKEKSYSYLLLPVTAFEKFLFELLSRIVLFALLIPALYWAIFHLEGSLVQWAHPRFNFQSFSFFDGFHLRTAVETKWMINFTAAEGLLFLTVPFFGASAFMKNPIVKTVAWSIGIVAAHLIFYAILHNNQVSFSRSIFQTPGVGIVVMTIYVLLVNAALVARAYFKLRRKEV